MNKGGRPKAPLILSDDERQKLETWAARPKSTQRLATRARIILACAEGLDNKDVAARLRVNTATVGKWRKRFLADRLEGLADEPRPGALRTITDAMVERVVTKTLEEKPKAATHWSTRGMAKAVGLSQTAIGRIWRAFGLKPHLQRDLQALHRPLLRREGPRRRRAVHEPAGECHRPVGRREEPGAGPGPHPTAAADDPRPGRAPDARLRPQRDDLAVRRAERGHRPGDRQVLPAASAAGVPQVPQRDRRGARRGSRASRSTSSWTTTGRTRRRA